MMNNSFPICVTSYHEIIYCSGIFARATSRASCLICYYEGAEIIYGQVAGFSARYTEIWKSGNCYLLPFLHHKQLEGTMMLHKIYCKVYTIHFWLNLSSSNFNLFGRKLICKSIMCNQLIAILQAMQYASPKAVWNKLFGVTQPPLEQKEGNKTILCCYVDFHHFLYFPISYLTSFVGAIYNTNTKDY